MSSRADDPRTFAGTLARDLSARGVRALLLQGPGPDEPFGLELLVPSGHASRARAVLEGYDWNYQLGDRGLWRVLPVSVYSWARAPYLWREAPMVELSWGVVAAPLPSRAFDELERVLWKGASSHPLGWAEPDAESLTVYLSLQAARDRSRREERLRRLSQCLPLASWARTEQIADRCGISTALRWAADAAQQPRGRERGPSPAPPPTDGAARRVAWRVGSFLAAHAYPRPLRPLISGRIGFGGSPARCRFAGVEILVGPGVFVPELTSERLVELALKILSTCPDPLIVEPGTGSGAISLAIAAGHPGARVHAVEKYGGALHWAKRNARRLKQRRVHLHRGSLLDPLPKPLAGRVALIVANLPYVPRGVWSAKGRFVRQAVRGQDDDGLGLYRRLARQAGLFLKPGGHLILEMGPYQVDAFRAEVTPLGYSIESVQPEVLGAVVVTARLGADGPPPGAPGDGPAATLGG